MNSIKLVFSQRYLKNLNYLFFSILCIDLLITFYVDFFVVGSGGIPHPITSIFYIRSESSLHNWISSLVLLLTGLLSFIVGTNTKCIGQIMLARCFYFFGFMTIGMAADEEAMIHETIGRIYNELTTSGTLSLKTGYWLTAYLPLIFVSILFLLFMLKNLKSTYPQAFLLFTMALLLWISAVGIEFLDGRLKPFYGEEGVWRSPVRYATEYAECLGSYLFLFTMIKCIELYKKYESTNTKANGTFSGSYNS